MIEMSNPERETYSTVFASLKHPIRRKVLRTLSAGPQSFSDMQKTFGIESSHLTYHLESLGNLLLKTDDGKYALSSFGEAAVSMMNQVEGPPTRRLGFPFPSKKWKYIVAALIVGLLLLSAAFCFEYQSLSQLSAQSASIKTENELLKEALGESLNLGNGSLTYRFEANSMVAPALLTFNENISTFTYPLGHPVDDYWIYNMVNDSTLEMDISFPDNGQVGLDVIIWVPSINTQNISNTISSGNIQAGAAAGASAVAYELVWFNITKNATLSVQLPSSGQYEISFEAPTVNNITDVREINYAMTLQLKVQGTSLPFFFISSGAGTWVQYG